MIDEQQLTLAPAPRFIRPKTVYAKCLKCGKMGYQQTKRDWTVRRRSGMPVPPRYYLVYQHHYFDKTGRMYRRTCYCGRVQSTSQFLDDLNSGIVMPLAQPLKIIYEDDDKTVEEDIQALIDFIRDMEKKKKAAGQRETRISGLRMRENLERLQRKLAARKSKQTLGSTATASGADKVGSLEQVSHV